MASLGAESGLVRWDDDLVEFKLNELLPQSCCMICGAEAEIRAKKSEFFYVHPLTYLLLLVGVVVGGLLILLVQKKTTLEVPLCPKCTSRWTMSSIVMAVFGLVGFFGFPILFGAAGQAIVQGAGGLVGTFAGVLGWVVALVMLRRFWASRHRVTCKKIDDVKIWLRVPNPVALKTAWTRAGVSK